MNQPSFPDESLWIDFYKSALPTGLSQAHCAEHADNSLALLRFRRQKHVDSQEEVIDLCIAHLVDKLGRFHADGTTHLPSNMTIREVFEFAD